MAGPTSTIPQGTQDTPGTRAVQSISPNTRVQASSRFLATGADQLLFGGPSVTGRWVAPDQRVRVAGVPSVSASSIGVAFAANGASTGPIQVVQGDARTRTT